MDLTGRLLRLAATRPHALVVGVPGQVRARLAVEGELGRRGWPTADSPADADLLVVAGHAGPQLSDVVETVWAQMPAPRARVTVSASTAADALDAAARELADVDAQQGDPEHAEHAMSSENTAGDDAASDDAHHGHHGHGGAMEMPGGIPMADLGEDRDGLMLDALHVPLGPLLPNWPAGLVLRVVLQGDVIREAEAEVLDPPDPTPDSPPSASGSRAGSRPCFWTEPAQRAADGEPVTVGEVARRAAAGHLDGLSRFLGVAGWADPAARARRLRDALLGGDRAGRLTPEIRDLAAWVRRSRTLRWLVRGIPAGDDDVAGRLSARVAALGAALDALEDASLVDDADPAVLHRLDRAGTAPGELAAAVVGAEFAAARLVVAALDPDTDLFTAAREASHRDHG